MGLTLHLIYTHVQTSMVLVWGKFGSVQGSGVGIWQSIIFGFQSTTCFDRTLFSNKGFWVQVSPWFKNGLVEHCCVSFLTLSKKSRVMWRYLRSTTPTTVTGKGASEFIWTGSYATPCISVRSVVCIICLSPLSFLAKPYLAALNPSFSSL